MISNRLFAAFVLALCMLSLYGVTFSGPYLSDDYWLISYTIQDLWGIVERLVMPLPEDVTPRFYREAWRLSYFLDIGVFDLNPFLSRLFNGLLHLANGLLLFLLYKKLLGNHLVALFGGVLFVVFPVHVGAVAWVAARCDLLAVLFSLSALNLYAGALASGFTRRVRLGIGLCVFLACHSKETGLMSVPALTALHWFFSRRGAEQMNLGARVRDVWASTWWAWVWLAVYMAMRYWVLGTFLGGYERQREAAVTVGGVAEHLGLYLGALAFPITSLQSVLPDVAVALLVGAGLVFTYMAVGSAGRWAQACRFSILWTVLTILPSYGMTYAASRHLYSPAVTWCPLLVLVVHWIVSAGKRPGWPWIYVALCGCLIGYSWIASQAAIRPYREGAAVGAEVFEQARSLLDENDGKPVVLYDIPDSVGPCFVGRNAFPNSCRPPFHSDRGDPFVGMTETMSLSPKFEQTMVAIAFRSDSVYLKWDSELGTFLTADPPQLSPIVVRGKLVVGEGGILHLMPASIRVEGDRGVLLPLVNQFVILEGERVGSQEPPVLSVRDARRAEPMLLANEESVPGSVTLSVTGEPGDVVGLWASAERGLFSMGSAGALLLEEPIPWQEMRIPTAGTHEFTFEIPPSVRQGEVFLQALIYRRGEWQLGDLLVVEVGG